MAKNLLILLTMLGTLLTADMLPAGESLFRNLTAAGGAAAAAAEAAVIVPQLRRTADGATELSLKLDIRPGTHLYVEQLALTLPAGITAVPTERGKFRQEEDTKLNIYEGTVTLVYRLKGTIAPPLAFGVTYQGCTGKMCFLPQTQKLTADFAENLPAPDAAADSEAPETAEENDTGTDTDADNDTVAVWRDLAAKFTESRRIVGYTPAPKFAAWLLNDNEEDETAGMLDEALSAYGLWAVALLLLPLGLMLNLTPCVLPMIPINLAILGAVKAGKGRGFALGTFYGGGMALVYGALGIGVVLTGSRFGTINETAIFNFAVAAVFAALALAMFDIWNLDFTGLRKVKVDNKKQPFFGAFLLGGLTALLAGACVAPVLVWVLLLAADLYAKGEAVGLLLPFLLGAGMALPWPFLAAGLSRMPKPGAWMTRIKQAFGVLILAAAGYYAYLGWQLLPAAADDDGNTPAAVHDTLPGWHSDLLTAMREAQSAGKPLLLDFGGIFCHACTRMKQTTLVDPAVAPILEDFVKIEFLTDNSDNPLTDIVFEHYDVIGMPTYIILESRR